MLSAAGANYRVEGLDGFMIGSGRDLQVRLHQLPWRRVPADPRRFADGNSLTYIVDPTFGSSASGLTSAETEGAFDRAMHTWSQARCLDTMPIVKEPYLGFDPSVIDWLFGFGSPGVPYVFQGDEVVAGFYPEAFFEAVSGGIVGIGAFTLTYIFVDPSGNPTDIDHDGYLDTAFSETYFNNRYGDPSDPFTSGIPWTIGPNGLDLETFALHELGHGFGLGHWVGPPRAVMSPIYTGLFRSLTPHDEASLCNLYGRWPHQ